TLTVQDPLTVYSPPMSRTERVGDHLAFVAGVSGGGPQFAWQYNGNFISGATNNFLVLTNIQTTNAGTYTFLLSNAATPVHMYPCTLTVSNGAILPLARTNL